MADYFASIFGTEKDKVNCSFYFKIGACRHGDRCSRVHNKPSFSQTILLQNLYENPRNSTKGDGQYISDEEDQRHFDQFFEDIYVELEEKYGPIEEMNVCDNLGDHLIGNVYVKFKREQDAELAVEELNLRWFGGKPVYAELSTVTDFREAGCRQYEIGACTRGGFCNFMHLKQISDSCRRYLFGKGSSSSAHRSSDRAHKSRRSRSRSRSRSSSMTRRHDSSHRRDRRRRDRRHRSHRSSSRRHRSHSRSLTPPTPDTRSARGRSSRKRSVSPGLHARKPVSRSRSRSRSHSISPTREKKSKRPRHPKRTSSKLRNSRSRSRSLSTRPSRSRSRSLTPVPERRSLGQPERASSKLHDSKSHSRSRSRSHKSSSGESVSQSSGSESSGLLSRSPSPGRGGVDTHPATPKLLDPPAGRQGDTRLRYSPDPSP